jgi:hypothetical protein
MMDEMDGTITAKKRIQISTGKSQGNSPLARHSLRQMII